MSRKPYNLTPRRLRLTASRVDYGVMLAIRAVRDKESRLALCGACLYGDFRLPPHLISAVTIEETSQ